MHNDVLPWRKAQRGLQRISELNALRALCRSPLTLLTRIPKARRGDLLEMTWE